METTMDINAKQASSAAEGTPRLPSGSKSKNKGKYILAGILLLIISAGLIYLMIISDPAVSTKIRDISIVLFVFGSILICLALIILVVQLAILINLLQNEIRPILKTTKDTVNNVKGTVEFLNDNMVEPVIKVNSDVAGVAKVISILSSGFKKRKGR